jgi:hypothetical protein
MFSFSKFNQSLASWNTASAKTMLAMFAYSPFNFDLSHFKTDQVTILSKMFQSSSFNQDISSWDVSSAENLDLMFKSASSFSQNLCKWSSLIRPTTTVSGMFNNTSCLSPQDPTLGTYCFDCCGANKAKCKKTRDCCSNLVCSSRKGKCTPCAPKASKCKANGDCCTGFFCKKGKCNCVKKKGKCKKSSNCCTGKKTLVCTKKKCQKG